MTGAIRISLLQNHGMQEERKAAGPAGRPRQSPAQARLLAPAGGSENCKQSSCCCCCPLTEGLKENGAPRRSPPDDLKAIGCSGGDRRGGLKKNCHIATWVGEKIRFGSEMTCATCCTISSKRWRGTLEVSMSVHQRRFEPSALQRRGSAVDSRSGRFRQWGPLPLAPRPCACPVRASAPSRRRATSAPVYHPSYLRNCHSFNNRSYRSASS